MKRLTLGFFEDFALSIFGVHLKVTHEKQASQNCSKKLIFPLWINRLKNANVNRFSFSTAIEQKKSVLLYVAPVLCKIFPTEKNTFLRKKENESSCGMIGGFSKSFISQSRKNKILR